MPGGMGPRSLNASAAPHLGLWGVPVVPAVLPPLGDPQQHGDHFTAARIHDHRDAVELMHPIGLRVARPSTVGLVWFRRTAENLAEREPELGGAVGRVWPDSPAPQRLEPQPELPPPGLLRPSGDGAPPRAGPARLVVSVPAARSRGTGPSTPRAGRRHWAPASSPMRPRPSVSSSSG